MSAESLAWIEMFSLGYRAANRDEAVARDAEALAWLEKWTREGEGDG